MDRRIKKTKQLLKSTLVKMMATQDFRKITVSSLTKTADINRGTFYLHYLDIFDMIDKLENDTINNINTIINDYRVNLLNNDYYKALLAIAEYVKNDRDFFKVLLSENGDIAFVNKIKKKMMKTYLELENERKIITSDKTVQMALGSFIVSGGIGLFQDWIYSNFLFSPSTIIKELYSIFTYTIKK